MSAPRAATPVDDALPTAPGIADDRLRDLYELACSTARLGVFERDLRTGAGSWNRELFEIRGIAGETAAPPFEEAASGVIEADRVHFDAAMRGSLLPRQDPVRRQSYRLRYRVRVDDGSIRHLHKQWVVHYGADGRAEQMRGVVFDDTPYQTLLLRQGDALAQLDLAAELTGLAFWRQDLTTGLVHINARAGVLFDTDPGATAMPLLRIRMSLHPDDRAAAEAADASALATQQPVDTELRCRSRVLGWRRLLTRRGVQVASDGRVVALVGVALDATERPGATVAPMAVPGDAGLRDNAASFRFLSRVSHELRTPMNAVLGFAQLLSFDNGGSASRLPDRAVALAHITEAGQHLMALINDVLELSRLEGGEMPLTLRPVALAQVTASSLHMLELPLRERRMSVETQGLALDVLGDATRLRQVLLNLIGNAIKYGRDGGHISVEAAAESGQVRLCVADDGCGLSAEQLRHVFEPFNRLGAEAGAAEGTGLGLSITRALVERMGGSIQVRSVAGSGCVFELRLLPAAAA